MSEHSVDHAEKNLSDLIDRALAGEGVLITRQGRPIVALQPIRQSGRPVTPEDLTGWRGAAFERGGRPTMPDSS